MKHNLKCVIILMMPLCFNVQAKVNHISKNITKNNTLDLCVNYHNNKDVLLKKSIVKELERRTQLAYKDYQNLKKHTIKTNTIEKGQTLCGMYMSIGLPLKEKTRKLRPFVYKSVHVYPKKYIVTEMGMVVDIIKRKKHSALPKLQHNKPKIQNPPIIMKSPGGQAIEH